MSQGWGEVLGNFEGYWVGVDECRELDDERVLVLAHSSGRGKTSGLALEQLQQRGAILFHLRDQKVTGLVLYWNRDHALADLGLAPEADPPAS